MIPNAFRSEMLSCCLPRQQPYLRNELGDQVYPQKRNGSEYYLYDPSGNPLFALDRTGGQRYARDAEGNEIYPKVGGFLYHPQWGHPVYARNALGNETYPRSRGGGEVFAELSDGEMLPARYAASGRQRYPLDRHGNEYMPRCKITGKPYYLQDEKGYPYRPVTVNGYPIYLHSEEADADEDRLYEKTDTLGSTVYTADHKMKRISIWMRVKESCVVGGCLLFLAIDLCLRLCHY